MQKLYPLATLLTAVLLVSGAQAQTGGTYTAVRNGNWHVASGPNVWDPNGEPPANCNNCAIFINSGVTVTLNRHVVLFGSSLLTVGSDGSSAAALLIPSSGGANFAAGNNIFLPNDGSSPANRLVLNDGSAFINATNAGTYDGVLASYYDATSNVTNSYKALGNAPNAFVDDNVANNMPSGYGKTLSGPASLSGTGTLPVTIVDFDAVAANGEVSVTWVTTMEQNSARFDIERSSNGGGSWDVIGKIAAKGQSATAVNYSFKDANPGSGTLQYRVREYDLDGRPTTTPIKVVRIFALATVTIFPNPAKDYVNVSLPASDAAAGPASIRLIGQSGQLIAEKKASGGTIVSFPVGNYSPGNYLVQIIGADGSKQISKVMISKQ